MDVTKRNDVSIYCLSSGPTIPEWLGDRARRNMSKKDEAVRRRIELLQDFQMPASSSRLVQSPDGRYIMVAGTYAPRVRCYDIHQLTMKFERYVNAEVLDIVMLGEDYGKFALLQEDRTISFHAPYGTHESIRIPTFGRAMAYEPLNCELLVAAKGNMVYRVNLDEGRFSEPWTYEPSSASTSCITVNPSYPSACVGCDDGMVRFWDSRASDSLLRPILNLDVQSATVGYGYAQDEVLRYANPGEITSLSFDSTGMYLAAGTGGGLAALYDVRSSRPLFIQEHKDGLPIHTIRFHAESGLILSGDERLVKAWRYKSMSTTSGIDDVVPPVSEKDGNAIGAVRVNIEGTSKLKNFIVAGDESDPTGNRSGIILCAADQPKLESYFVPAIGVAPKWCSFLDSITEELEERDLNQDDGGADDLVRSGKQTIYENYKFVTRDDLEKLGVSNLIGTPLLRGYMHGFFMNVNLYNRVKAVANPFEYEEYQKKKLKERLDAKRSSRIAPKESRAKGPKAAVNPELAERLEHKAEDSTKAGKVAKNVLSDDRFGSLFTNPDFQIDEEDEDFKLRNPSGVAAVQRKKNNLDSDDEDDEASASEVEESNEVFSEEEEEGRIDGVSDAEEEDDDDDAMDSDSDDGFRGGKVRGEAYDALRVLERDSKKKRKPHKKPPTLYETEGLDGAGALGLATGNAEIRVRARKRLEEMELPLAERLAAEETHQTPKIRVSGGSKEASFIPSDTKRKLEAEKNSADNVRGKRNRRGIKELKLKTPFKNRR